MCSQRTSSLSELPSIQPKLAIVLLAAGEGSRMGSILKALLRRDGKTLLESFCMAASSLEPIEFLVMTGFHAELIEAELHRLQHEYRFSVHVKRHLNPQEGQSSTVRLALESMRTDYDVLAMCLSDQPNINAKSIQELLKQFAQRDEQQQIVMPIVNG
jgi:molybdenum cofactor cytidylyltransferase